MGLEIFGVITAVMVLIGIKKKRWEIVGNYLMRCGYGLVFIYLFNTILEEVYFIETIGCNGLTVGFSGLMGLPGLVILYGINHFIL